MSNSLVDFHSGLARDAGAGLDELLGVVSETAARSRIPRDDALALAALAAALGGGEHQTEASDRSLDAVAAALDPGGAGAAARLPDVAALAAVQPQPTRAKTFLGHAVDAVLSDADDHGLSAVGGELASFAGAAMGKIGLGFLNQSKASARKPGDAADALVFFIIGGVTLRELRDVNDVLDRHGPAARTRVVLAATTLASPDAVAAALFAPSASGAP